MNLKKMLAVLAAGLMIVSCDKYKDLPDGIYAAIRPEKGQEILVNLYYKEVPMTTGSFVALAEGNKQGDIDPKYQGKKFFDSLVFHRVEKDFVVQTGDPTGTGTEGPGYYFPIEIVDSIKHAPGVIAMANSTPLTNGSQFYITMAETPWLDGRYTVFGRMVNPDEDMERVKAIAQGDRIKQVEIIRKGADAQAWDANKAFTENRKRVVEEYNAKVKAALEAFFQDAQVTKSGLKIKTIEQGKGRKYKKGENATVHYTGKLEDGTTFDSSRYFGRPFTFKLGAGQVIKGWDEAVAMLPIGTKAVVYVPSELAYGERGAGDRIGPNTNLIFEIEVLEPAK